MTENPTDEPKGKRRNALAPLTREERLKAALKANMARRKAQARSRSVKLDADGPAPDGAGGETSVADRAAPEQ